MSHIEIDYVSLEKAISTLESLAPRVRELAEYHGADFTRAVKADLSSGSASGDVSPMFAPAWGAAQAGIARWVAAMTAQAAHIETLAATLSEWRDAARAGDMKAVAEIERVSAVLSSDGYRTFELEDPDNAAPRWIKDLDGTGHWSSDPTSAGFHPTDPNAPRWVRDLDGSGHWAPSTSTT